MKQIAYTDHQKMLKFQIFHNKSRVKKTKSKSRSESRNRHIETVKKLMPDVVNILCIGCRSESEMADFLNKGFVPTGIDILPSKKYTVMDAHEIGDHFKKDQFDFVYASHCFEHFYDPNLVMRGIKKVSRMGVFIVLPSWSPNVYNYKKKISPSLSHPAIYDLMFRNRQKLSEVTEKDLNDFQELKPCKLIHYKKNERNKKNKTTDECELLLSWR